MSSNEYMLELLTDIQAMQRELFGIQNIFFDIDTRETGETRRIAIDVSIRNSNDDFYKNEVFYSFDSVDEIEEKYKILLEIVQSLKTFNEI